MGYLLRTNTSNEHLAKKFERPFQRVLGETAQEWQLVDEDFLLVSAF